MTVSADYVKRVQVGLGVTNYEFAFILGVAEKTVEAWRGGWRSRRDLQRHLSVLLAWLRKHDR